MELITKVKFYFLNEDNYLGCISNPMATGC